MPFYEYACRTCGARFEKLRKMEERLAAPACATCRSRDTVLRLSVPGMVGAAQPAASDGIACGGGDPDACCGGACFAPN